MTWKVLLHPLVLDEDIPRLDKPERARIFKAMRERLATAPHQYGEPLRGELFGYWKLRVGDFRVIYKMRKQIVTVLVLKIGPRRDSEVYADMVKRLKAFEA
ncbi:MAG: type II toxin-antitoxin system RelE/ParE family toxin [Elusimicrobia bacterium]|nr:type II toxin-antitoxin system RelE/ParE family toxin [Elusimicrobiota bacterium]